MKLTRQELLAVIDNMRAVVAIGDSFEGNIHYTCMTEGLEQNEFEVSATYRVGNLDGQGGCRVIPAATEQGG